MKRRVLGAFAFLPFLVAVSSSDPPAAPVPAACHPLSTTLGPIAGLQTGQVVVDGEMTTLRFSSDVRACGEWSNEVRDDCHAMWSFQIDLPSAKIVPGEHYLDEARATFGDLVVTTSVEKKEEGCSSGGDDKCTTSIRGAGSMGITSPVAKLTIDSVDDACITGTLVGIDDPFSGVDPAKAPNFNGAFFAVRCAR